MSKQKYVSFDDILKNVKDLYTQEEIDRIKEAFDSMESLRSRKATKIRDVIPIRQWIEDYYYVGPDVDRVYPFWKERIIDIFEAKDRVNQVILTGSLGIGKSTAAVLIIIRVLYELSCYKNIASLFNLFGVSRIAFAYLSVNREQAMNTGFALLQEWLDSIPYFRDEFPRKNNLDSMLIWPQERLLVTYGSVANHFIGMNLIGSILDEANFFSGRSKEDADYKMNTKVSELYSQIISRAESRFIVNGVNYSMSILVSSATSESSFTEQRITESADDPHTVVISAPLWEVKPWNYKGGKFLVYVGGYNTDPQVIRDVEQINALRSVRNYPPVSNVTLKEAYATLPTDIKSRILEVPVEHYQSFQGDIVTALQNIAGYSVSSANKLFSSNASYDKCIDSQMSHPFSKEQIVLSTTKSDFNEGFMPIKAYMKNGFKFRNPKAKRFMHLDLALTGDSVGISMAHIAGWSSIYTIKESEPEDNPDTPEIPEYMRQFIQQDDYSVPDSEIKVPIIEVDFMIRVNPPKKPSKISLSKIRDFIIFLRNDMKIQFEIVTADQFQSAQILQELAEMNFNTGYLSVDRTAEPYLSFVNLIYEERIRMYHYEPFKHELFNVIHYPGRNKVDHPPKGSKDVSDSVVGSVYNAIKSSDKTDMNEQNLTDLFIAANKGEDNIEEIAEQFKKGLMDILAGGKITKF